MMKLMLQWTPKGKKYLLPLLMISFVLAIVSIIGNSLFAIGMMILEGQIAFGLPAFGVIFLCSTSITVLGEYALAILKNKATEENALYLKGKILRSALQNGGKGHTGEWMMRGTTDADLVSAFLPTVMIPALSSILSILVASVICWFASPLSCLVIWGTLLLDLWVNKGMGKKLSHTEQKKRSAEEQLRIFIQDRLSAFPLWKITPASGPFTQQLTQRAEEKGETALQHLLLGRTIHYLSNTLCYLPILLNLMICGYLVSQGRMSMATMSALIFIAEGCIVWPASNLPKAYEGIVEGKLALSRILNQLGHENPAPRILPPLPNALPPVSIQLQEVGFAYGTNPPILQHFNQTIPATGTFCIAGESGGGKTTLLALIAGLLSPTEGKILFADGSGSPLPYEGDQLVSIVPQGYSLYEGTIRENLLMGNPTATEQQLTHALKQADCLDFIAQLPQGLNSLIGATGVALSGGQAQRLAIARALLKEAPILLFDEPTASLDGETERQIIGVIQHLAEKKSCLVVSHRPAVIEACTQVIYR